MRAKIAALPEAAASGRGRLLRSAWWLGFASLVAIADQASKQVALVSLEYQQPVVVTSFFNLTLTFNPGAAFSFLSSAGGWQRWLFITLAAGISMFLIAWITRLTSSDRMLGWSLSLILGGALGNLWDRVYIGAVVDFIDVHYAGWHWPAFNVADSAICVGALLFAVYAVLEGRGESKPQD